MKSNKKQNGIGAIGVSVLLVVVLIGFLSIKNLRDPNGPIDLSDDKDLVIIKVYKDSNMVAQVATIPNKVVSFGSYRVVFQKR